MKKMTMRFLLFSLCLLSISSYAALNPQVDSIPMRDGKKLAADIYIPSGCSSCPVILIQTPYGRTAYRNWLPLGIGLNINASNYVVVTVDWRGTGGSIAALNGLPNRGQDGYDCIDWIAQQSWSNGKVGTWGPSALGKCQFQTAKEQHPAHICMVPQVAGPQFDYLEYFPGGVYRKEYVDQLDALGYNMSSTLLANTVDSPYWTFVENANFYPGSIAIPCFMQGGWYDHNVDLMLTFFNALRSSSPLINRNNHRLLMGPWVHGGHGAAYVGSTIQGQLTYPNAAGWSDSLAMLFFDYHLRNIANGFNTTDYVTYYQMGENNWKTSSVWPPIGVTSTKLYLQNNYSLTSGQPTSGNGSSTIIFDPSNPSPTVGGPILRADLDQGPYDQSPIVENRNDILIFDSPVLGQDVVLKGSIKAHLFVSTDRLDSDFAIRLTDVYPDGRSMILQDGIRRLRFRNGYTANDTMAAVPGTVYELDIQLMTTANTFLAGHKIRVDITSSNYPRFDVNLNNGGTMYTAGDTLTAINTVFHNSTQASYVEFMLEDFIGAIAENESIDFSLYPNPTQHECFISIGAPSQIEIIDAMGRICFITKLSEGIHTLATDKLQKGMYFVKVNQDNATCTKKLIIH